MPTVKMKKVTSRHAVWSNAKYAKRNYSGHYDTVKGERAFVLSTTLKNKKVHSVPFGSHEEAKKAGWKRV
jgi:hypothetical protein